jgi:hypothetical protein
MEDVFVDEISSANNNFHNNAQRACVVAHSPHVPYNAQSLIIRHGKHNGTRQMIELLGLGRQHGHQRLAEAPKAIHISSIRPIYSSGHAV